MILKMLSLQNVFILFWSVCKRLPKAHIASAAGVSCELFRTGNPHQECSLHLFKRPNASPKPEPKNELSNPTRGLGFRV